MPCTGAVWSGAELRRFWICKRWADAKQRMGVQWCRWGVWTESGGGLWNSGRGKFDPQLPVLEYCGWCDVSAYDSVVSPSVCKTHHPLEGLQFMVWSVTAHSLAPSSA